MPLNIGENIKKLRSEKGVTQEQLAEHLSITYQSVSKWENNVTSPDLYLIPAIAAYFEVSIDDLFKLKMDGYRNKANRLFAVYEHTHIKVDYDKADEEYEKLFSDNKADEEDMRIYGTLNQYHAEILAKKAEELLRKSIKAGHATADAQLLRLLMNLGRNQENIDTYEEKLKKDPENSRNWHLLSISYQNSKMYEKALETALKGLEKFPEHDGLLHQCGELYKNLNRYDEAFDYWNRSFEQEPANISNYYSMAFAYTELKKYEEAVGAWRKVIDFCESAGLLEDAEWPKKELLKLQTLIEANNQR
jgi:transcriptional regulator with XRE-family HTH domain